MHCKTDHPLQETNRTWDGPVGRAPKKPDGSKGDKIQGPLLGLLKEAGYTAEEVFKY